MQNSYQLSVFFSDRSNLGLLRHLALVLLLGLSSLSAQAALPIQQWQARSGAKVLFVESHAIPMLDLNIDFDAGSRYDPPGKTGLASFTENMLGRGVLQPGSADQLQYDEAQLADQWADTGAQQAGAASLDRTSITLRTLTSTPEKQSAISLLTGLISRPAFSESIFQRELQRSIRSLKESESKPETIAQRAFSRAVYGSHPYGAILTQDTLAALQLNDVRAFYQAHYGANKAVVTLIGDISRQEAEQIAEQLTGDLPKPNQDVQNSNIINGVPKVANLTEASEQRIVHPSSQAHVLIGQPGMARGNPDYFPLLVGNYILGGGGFVSRLTQEVREQRGLTYSVYSYFSPLAEPGPFTIGLQTRKDQADQALQVVRQTLNEFIAKGPTEAELKAAKQNLVGGFALRIDNNRKLLDNLSAIGYYSLPLDYLDTWTSKVEAVKVPDIRAAFQRTLDPAKMATVIVGTPAP